MQVNKVVFAILMVLWGCNPKELSPRDYSLWIKDYAHGLHKKKQVDKIVFDVQYKPVEFILLTEGKGNVPAERAQDKIKEGRNWQYFTLKIQLSDSNKDFLKEGVQEERDFYNRLYYYSFGFKNDITLESGGKFFPCKLFHFERSYDLSKSRTFVLGFESNGDAQDKTLVIDSKDLGLGKIKIEFSKDELNSIPKLKI